METSRKVSGGIGAIVAGAILALVLGPAAAGAQQPGQPEYGNVEGVELVSPRIDGPPALILFTAAGKVRPAAGAYVSEDRKALTIKDGRIVSLSDPMTELGRFEVASIDPVFLRHASTSRLYLKDARGRSLPLPDGRFTSREGMTLLIRDGVIVGYGKRR